jgi:hypothetical protein
MTKRLLVILPLALAALIGAAIFGLPGFVATSISRPAIAALAGSVTGQKITINGPVSLALLPEPRLVAQNIILVAANGDMIRAAGLSLDISLTALAHGRLSADSLILTNPEITLPWPLPGGAAALAPPHWLASLHAVLQNGTLSAGGITLTHLNASILTKAGGALSITGTFTCNNQNVSATIKLAASDPAGTALLTITASSGTTNLALTGALNNTSAFGGTLAVTGPNLTGNAAITATPDGITASAITLTAGAATLTGSAAANASPASASLDLTGANFDLLTLAPLLHPLPGLPVSLSLTVTNTTLGAITIPQLAVSADFQNSGASIHQLTATLAGNALLTGSFGIGAGGALSGTAHLTTTRLDALTGPLPAGWSNASLSASLGGTAQNPAFFGITGNLGPSLISGSASLAASHAYGALHFSALDLTAWAAWARTRPSNAISLGGEITADDATLAGLPLSHLLLDGDVDGGVSIRRVSASLYGGLATGSLSLDGAGNITAITGFLLLPSAEKLRPLLPFATPPLLLAPPLALSITGNGPAHALAANVTARLGDFSLTASPVIDLAHLRLSGGLALRHPSAMTAAGIFGLDHSLAWPGAGSFSLRAYVTAAPAQYGMPYFVLSLGDTSLTGRLMVNNSTMSGDITADTLALPPLSTGLTLGLSHLALPGTKISLSSNQVLYAGAPLFGPTSATLSLAPDQLAIGLTRAAFAGGTLSGTATLQTPAPLPPALSLTASLTGADAAKLALPWTFPYPITAGTLAGTANLTASGYTTAAWAATLAGTASLTASQGSITGFALASISSALATKNRAKPLHAALTSGSTGFTSLTLASTLAQGNASLTTATLTSPAGTVSATGNINLPSETIALKLLLGPALTPPLTLSALSLGSWTAPKQILHLKPALIWQAEKP